ncbi:MAG: aspartate aminotransferase family protein [Verrucomicrobiota bacterium]|nr:aspartate aminotransferase family protein [Verrucomicrobiota bacterium]
MTSTQKNLALLKEFECPNITYMPEDNSWPIVWERASGVSVWDVEKRHYLDLTAAFGVAACGHANRAIVRAGQAQMKRLLHAMGDVHPHPLKGELAKELSRITFEKWSRTGRKAGKGKTIFCNSGFEAVEAALKTAQFATGKPGVIAFKSAYHGLGYGALVATDRPHFKKPFTRQLAHFVQSVEFPLSEPALAQTLKAIQQILEEGKTGAVLVEPIQARGGINVPPEHFLRNLRRLCDQHSALLVLDEIYTGFGRTGEWFACEREHVVPDLICLGKAMTGGFPLSACVGRAEIMDAWPISSGEAIHTSTFLGHPVGCAMALAQIHELEHRNYVKNSRDLGKYVLELLNSFPDFIHFRCKARGRGLMIGLELLLKNGKPATRISLTAIARLLQRGFIFLPEGEHSNIIAMTPPLTIKEKQLERATRALKQILQELDQ